MFAALLAVLLGGVAVVALAGGGGDESDEGSLKVERSFVPGTRQPELVVSVDRRLNSANVADDGRSVVLECSDAEGRRVIRARVDWPWLDEPNYPLPHVHQPATSQELSRIEQCRVDGTSERLSGRMRLRTG